LLILAATALLALAQAKPIPQLVKSGGKFTLLVDGKPFIILGGQIHNPNAFPDLLEPAWPRLKALNANTVEYPVYWNEIEPQEGHFEFGDFDLILRKARSEGLRVILLWFGTWKNGSMDWVPNWVKSDTARFSRVIDSGGKPIRNLSPHSKNNLDADRKAYVAMMQHLKAMDEADRTVILMQVENESGLLGSVRDYTRESNALFAGPVPEKLVTALKKKPGTWTEVFGSDADEAFTVYYLSSYIGEVARAGKQVYPLPAYVNCWNGGHDTADQWDSYDRPGETYPSGGPVSHMLDLWKAAAPDIDILSSDTTKQPSENFRMINLRYTRPDNPYFSPEAGEMATGGRVFFWSLANLNGLGFGVYGVDMGSAPGLDPRFADLAADFGLIRATMPAIADLQQKGKLRAAIEEEKVRGKNLTFDQYQVLVRFRPRATAPTPSARVLMGELGPDEFLILGFDSAVDFRPLVGSKYTAAQLLQADQVVYENGAWKTTGRGRTYQGSYDPPSVSLPAQGAIYRVKLMRY
jgi:hypothetical protein